jgi:hypothetical protein
MSDQDHIVIERGYVRIEEPSGFEVILEEQKFRLQVVAAACRDANTNKVLINGPATKVSLSAIELLELAEKIAELKLQVALVVNTDISSGLESFFVEMASDRGSPMRFFENEEAAKDWLNI